ncbi:MAG TPA: WD40 repeat domain-containing protein, partial [Desulfosalsimonadaceae bacterium]|nr:WD40 repeat domain-containing protein [Desulfosalsimonadaceae bacterium]
MNRINNWDWAPGKRVISDIGEWRSTFGWVEEPCASPDGESVAAIVKVDEDAFAVCENGTPWETSFDRIWFLRYLPDGRAAAFVSN